MVEAERQYNMVHAFCVLGKATRAQAHAHTHGPAHSNAHECTHARTLASTQTELNNSYYFQQQQMILERPSV